MIDELGVLCRTIRYCIDRDCRVILASHAGRPKPNEYDEANSLRVVKTRLKTLLKMADRISLAKDVVGDDAKAKVEALKAGEVLLLENLRLRRGRPKMILSC